MALFFGWRVVGAALVIAVFGWGFGFYGPPVFLHAVERSRGWSPSLISAASTCHFLAGALVVARIPWLHRRHGVAGVTRAGAVAAAVGALGWALAASPWQLFAATLVSGAGWGATGGATINAIIAPWFARRRPAALGAAFNGASLGGVLLAPLWTALIGWLGFPLAALVLGGTMVGLLWWLAGRYLVVTPAAMGLSPDGDAADAPRPPPRRAAPLGPAPWRDPRFASLAACNALVLFAQLGLIAQLVSLLAPSLGDRGAGLALGLATGCAIAGRMIAARLLGPGVSRRAALAVNCAVQTGGVALLGLAGGAPAALLAAVALFGLGIGNATTLPLLIAQQDFAEADVPRVVALGAATGQAVYAFAPAFFGLLRGVDQGAMLAGVAACQVAAAAILLCFAGARSCDRMVPCDRNVL